MLKIQVSATSKKDEESVTALANAIACALDDEHDVQIREEGFKIDLFAGDDMYFDLIDKIVIIERVLPQKTITSAQSPDPESKKRRSRRY